MFEWQQHTHSQNDILHYSDMLKFLDSRAQASEVSILPKPFKNSVPTKSYHHTPSWCLHFQLIVTSRVANVHYARQKNIHSFLV